MNDDCRALVEWDSEFHKMYESHGVLIRYQPWEFKKHNPGIKPDDHFKD